MSHYDTLGVPKDAPAETVKRAYRRKASKAHPDKGGSAASMHEALRRLTAELVPQGAST